MHDSHPFAQLINECMHRALASFLRRSSNIPEARRDAYACLLHLGEPIFIESHIDDLPQPPPSGTSQVPRERVQDIPQSSHFSGLQLMVEVCCHVLQDRQAGVVAIESACRSLLSVASCSMWHLLVGEGVQALFHVLRAMFMPAITQQGARQLCARTLEMVVQNSIEHTRSALMMHTRDTQVTQRPGNDNAKSCGPSIQVHSAALGVPSKSAGRVGSSHTSRVMSHVPPQHLPVAKGFNCTTPGSDRMQVSQQTANTLQKKKITASIHERDRINGAHKTPQYVKAPKHRDGDEKQTSRILKTGGRKESVSAREPPDDDISSNEQQPFDGVHVPRNEACSQDSEPEDTAEQKTWRLCEGASMAPPTVYVVQDDDFAAEGGIGIHTKRRTGLQKHAKDNVPPSETSLSAADNVVRPSSVGVSPSSSEHAQAAIHDGTLPSHGGVLQNQHQHIDVASGYSEQSGPESDLEMELEDSDKDDGGEGERPPDLLHRYDHAVMNATEQEQAAGTSTVHVGTQDGSPRACSPTAADKVGNHEISATETSQDGRGEGDGQDVTQHNDLAPAQSKGHTGTEHMKGGGTVRLSDRKPMRQSDGEESNEEYDGQDDGNSDQAMHDMHAHADMTSLQSQVRQHTDGASDTEQDRTVDIHVNALLDVGQWEGTQRYKLKWDADRCIEYMPAAKVTQRIQNSTREGACRIVQVLIACMQECTPPQALNWDGHDEGDMRQSREHAKEYNSHRNTSNKTKLDCVKELQEIGFTCGFADLRKKFGSKAAFKVCLFVVTTSGVACL
jgi:hypothetical protein